MLNAVCFQTQVHRVASHPLLENFCLSLLLLVSLSYSSTCSHTLKLQQRQYEKTGTKADAQFHFKTRIKLYHLVRELPADWVLQRPPKELRNRSHPTVYFKGLWKQRCTILYGNCWVPTWTTEYLWKGPVSPGSTGEGNSAVAQEGVDPGCTSPRPHLRADYNRRRISFWRSVFCGDFPVWAEIFEGGWAFFSSLLPFHHVNLSHCNKYKNWAKNSDGVMRSRPSFLHVKNMHNSSTKLLVLFPLNNTFHEVSDITLFHGANFSYVLGESSFIYPEMWL